LGEEKSRFEVSQSLSQEKRAKRLAEFAGEVGGVRLFINGAQQDVVITLKDGESFARLGKLLSAIGKPVDTASAGLLVQVHQFLKSNGFNVAFDPQRGPGGAIIAVLAK
jgi:hypothetical protein